MRGIKQLTLITAMAAATILAATAVAIANPVGGPPPGCDAIRTPTGWQVVCGNGSGSPGGPGSGGSGGGGINVNAGCQIEALNGQTPPYPAPKGQVWMRLVCPSILNPGLPGGLVLVPVGSTNAAPGVTAQELLQWALAELNVPSLAPSTAPPAGKDGLVGLPEWYWIPAGEWHNIVIRVSVGPVFAQVTAVPGHLTFSPGGGLPSVSCPGPGTQYKPNLPLSAQHTNCSYAYKQSSALQPGGAYQASVSITWTASWVGSGGAGGPLNPPIQLNSPFALRIAEGQALVSRP